MCSLFLATAALCQKRLENLVSKKDYEAVKASAVEVAAL